MAHVYMGISYHGTTSLKFVTGTHKQVSKYINPKTKLPHKGVAADEYTDVLRDHFIPEGKKMFAHAGKSFSGLASKLPDLSTVENLWAWMDSHLHRHHKCKNVEQLKEKLEEVRQSIPASYLHNAFDGMNARMKRVLDLNAKVSQNSASKGSENEPQQHHKAPEEERAAAPHSKDGANADCQSEASQSQASCTVFKYLAGLPGFQLGTFAGGSVTNDDDDDDHGDTYMADAEQADPDEAGAGRADLDSADAGQPDLGTELAAHRMQTAHRAQSSTAAIRSKGSLRARSTLRKGVKALTVDCGRHSICGPFCKPSGWCAGLAGIPPAGPMNKEADSCTSAAGYHNSLSASQLFKTSLIVVSAFQHRVHAATSCLTSCGARGAAVSFEMPSNPEAAQCARRNNLIAPAERRNSFAPYCARHPQRRNRRDSNR
ncbi:TPA: hypothetical protein ACH3X1_001147 [Trebouxia sp. C0004]